VTPLAAPTIEVRGPARELLARFSPPVGFFEERVSLESLIDADAVPYAVLTFESTGAFETGGLEGRETRRDASWRSPDLALTAR
jgi:hypothetical protein